MDKGAYVLATKYSDGDPNDQWCIGFYDKEIGGRHYVVDLEGEQFRMNGFRRVAEISSKRGIFILKHAKEIEMGTRSLWWWFRTRMTNDD